MPSPPTLATSPPPGWTPAGAASSVALFVACALLEVGGGWCVWRAVHGPPATRARWALVAPGAVSLVGYGFAAAVQPWVAPAAAFARTYAVYGGVFVVFSYAWGWALDGQRPDVGEKRVQPRGGCREGGGGGGGGRRRPEMRHRRSTRRCRAASA